MVLVVDDDRDIRELVLTLLHLRGVEAIGVTTGIDALRLLTVGDLPRPEIVLLDIQMPELDGWDTLRMIRARPDLAAVRVILCTVKGQPADIERARKLGADGYVMKPFVVDDVVREIARVRGLKPSTVSDSPL